MGLDISAYEKLEWLRPIPSDWEYEYLTEAALYAVPAFASSCDGMQDGIYRKSGAEYEFRAGSYGGYNEWRRQLARLVDATPEAVWKGASCAAFQELINNADNEGFIGPTTSAKLAKDFAAWQERAEQFASEHHADDGGWFLAKYADWRKAFDIASKGGAVQLH
jgi:hypothetical protein